jgi:hypothetical protein
MSRNLTLAACAASIILATHPRPVHAQTLAGVVKLVITGKPLSNVRVFLATDSGTVVAQDTTRESGAFYLVAPKPGTYSVAFLSDSLQFVAGTAPIDLLGDSTVQKEYLLVVSTVGRAYTAKEVDRPARVFESSAQVISRARDMDIRGGSASVDFQFVVDSTGVPELATIRLIKSNDDKLAEIFRALIPQLRYEPAIKNGHPVRQILESGLEVTITTTSDGRP